MSERSDEMTEPERRARDGPATDDLLEETDRLLSDSSTDARRVSDPSADSLWTTPSTADSDTPSASATRHDAAESATTDSSRSWRSTLTSRLSPGRYFSPKAYAALVVLLGIGVVVGATVLPIAGRLIGMFVTAFATGLLASKRRYLEVMAAGISVGGVTAVLNNAILAVAGSGRTLAAVGVTVGLLATVGGYYFGRDLRAGLSRELE